MKQYYGYIRVSTVRQGTQGVSLIEQRDAISRFAQRSGFGVVRWFEEQETAAKHGRPIFNAMLKLLRRGKARGVILHKLDRGARNLKDWAELGELSDRGIEFHFAHESLDLHSRGGRLSADIQAVVSADYIRNLREETRKGFYGRLKQGLYPLRAPMGYLDNGKGRAKSIDPIMGPWVRKAFELYASCDYNFESLGQKLYEIGLRNKNGKRVSRNGLSTILNNPFYMGLIHIHKTGETFAGQHPPLIRKSLYDRVQQVLRGKFNTRIQRHEFLFRRLIYCAKCGYALIGERQKGHVYYRCHSKQCPSTTIKEETIQAAITGLLVSLQFRDEEKAYFRGRITVLRKTWGTEREDQLKSIALQLAQIKDRLTRLMDAFLDGSIEKPLFYDRKTALLMDQKAIEEQHGKLQRNEETFADRISKFLELAGSALLSYDLAFPDEKREMVKILTSNRRLFGKNLELEPSIGFREVVNRHKNMECDPNRAIPRTSDLLFKELEMLNECRSFCL